MAKCNKFEVGDLVIPVKNSNSHDYIIGEVYRVKDVNHTTVIAESLDGCSRGNMLRHEDCKPAFEDLDSLEENIKQVESNIKKLNSVKLELESKINWMKEVGADTFDKNEYRVWQALSTIEDGGLSKLEKVKLIATLLK
jgi:hypothetical protein